MEERGFGLQYWWDHLLLSSPHTGCLFPFCLPRRLFLPCWMQDSSQLMPSEIFFFFFLSSSSDQLCSFCYSWNPPQRHSATNGNIEISLLGRQNSNLLWKQQSLIWALPAAKTKTQVKSAEGAAIFPILYSRGELTQASIALLVPRLLGL